MLVVLGLVLTAGLLTLIGAAVRESVLPPGDEPDQQRRTRARLATGGAIVGAVLILWGGNVWWEAEAESYRTFIRYRPFETTAMVSDGPPKLTLGIRDARWTGEPVSETRYNALLPDHGKLMHMFLVRDDNLGAFAHLHPVARSSKALDFDSALPPLPPGRYRVYGDIVHESGYTQTLVNTVEVAATSTAPLTDPDDSFFVGTPSGGAMAADLGEGAQLGWTRNATALLAGQDDVLTFVVRDAAGNPLNVEPYMGMAAHVIVSSHDHSVFAHLHPAGSISMAALQKFTGGAAGDHSAHGGEVQGRVDVTLRVPEGRPLPSVGTGEARRAGQDSGVRHGRAVMPRHREGGEIRRILNQNSLNSPPSAPAREQPRRALRAEAAVAASTSTTSRPTPLGQSGNT